MPCSETDDDASIEEPHYQWTDARSRVANDGRYFVTETGDLVINDVQPRDSGQYDCIVTGSSKDTTPAPLIIHHNIVGE